MFSSVGVSSAQLTWGDLWDTLCLLNLMHSVHAMSGNSHPIWSVLCSRFHFCGEVGVGDLIVRSFALLTVIGSLSNAEEFPSTGATHGTGNKLDLMCALIPAMQPPHQTMAMTQRRVEKLASESCSMVGIVSKPKCRLPYSLVTNEPIKDGNDEHDIG